MDYKHVVYNAARDGKYHRLKGLLDKRSQNEVKILVSHKTNGSTPLLIAAKHGHNDVVDYLILKCNADIEQVGNVQVEGDIIEGVPPLWCASAAGHFNIVRMLINYGAKINSTTKTKSTPLRAACHDGHLEIVQYLVQHGADIEIANRHGHTCLMIACYRGHYKIAAHLIQQGADINRKSIKGNTALHDTAESGSVEIMHLLLANGAKMDVDSYGVSPMTAAALTGHRAITEQMISLPDCSKQDHIDALELLGATFVDKKRDIMSALELWRKALWERYSDPNNIIEKPRFQPVAAYGNAVEIRTVEQLDEMFSDPDEMRMQALLVRERILGPAHPDTSYYIKFRGALYADTGNFDKCIKLWMHALDMQQKILEPLSPMTQSSFLGFVELFYFMMSKAISAVTFNDLFSVFQRALCELQTAFLNASKTYDQESTNFHRTLIVVLHFIGLLCRFRPYLTSDEETEVKRAVYRLVRLNPRGRSGWSVIHLACYRDTSCQYVRFPICDFPMPEIVDLLLQVGASPHEVDCEKNTPLHIAASTKPMAKNIVQILLNHGAHLDNRNKRGQTALQMMQQNASNLIYDLYPLRHMSLKCLCAQNIIQNKVPFEGLIPEKLTEFVRNH